MWSRIKLKSSSAIVVVEPRTGDTQLTRVGVDAVHGQVQVTAKSRFLPKAGMWERRGVSGLCALARRRAQQGAGLAPGRAMSPRALSFA